MEIIVSHKLTDLDGLAAMIAANKLHPEAIPVFVGRVQQKTRDFMALYRDEFKVYNIKEIREDLNRIEKIIIVDTNSRDRLGELKNKIDWSRTEVIIYDHHPHTVQDWMDYDYSEKIGSAAAIIVNRIKEKDIEVNPIEATLFLLGIYADTGYFSHSSTTTSDLQAAAFLLSKGANLKIINQFLEERLESEQKDVLEELIENGEEENLKGVKINIFTGTFEQYIIGINKVAEKIKSLYHLDNIFVIAQMEDKVQIVGRSSDEAVNIGQICSRLGGGGHSGAGAAQLKTELQIAKNRLNKVLEQEIEPVNKVK